MVIWRFPVGVLSREARVYGDVLVFDEVRDHSAAVTVDTLAGTGHRVELACSDRTSLQSLGPTTSTVALRDLAANGVLFAGLQELNSLTCEGYKINARLGHVLTGDTAERLIDHTVLIKRTFPFIDTPFM